MMSEKSDIQQKITEAEYAATSATGDANITIIKNYYYREEARIIPDGSESENIALPCPYRGLFHFGPHDAELFFGREIFIEGLYKATQNRNFIPVLGASGSGKSSVILAGLVPKLQKMGHWQFTHFRPGSDPFYALAEALVPLYRLETDSTDRIIQAGKLAESLKEGTTTLFRIFSAIRQNYPQHRVLLIGDQFEEIYTLCRDEKVRRKFLDCLLGSLETENSLSAGGVVWAIAMRADFLGNALTYPPFADVLQDWDMKLRSMNREELAEVVEKPAASLEIGFEGGLVERILDDVEDQPGNLPLLEFALTELWEKRTEEVLTHEIYEAIGGVEGALARHVDGKYSNLGEEEKERVRRIFIQLVRPGEGTEDTRRIATKEELGAQNWVLVRQLADARLVVTSRNGAGRETVEVVHEALIRNWGELRGWMESDRTFRAWQERLRVFKRQWEDNKRDLSSLLRGAALVEAEEWLEKRSDELISEAEFIRLSVCDRVKEEKEKKARRRYNIGMAWSITVSSLLALFISIKLWSMARYEEKRAELNQADSLARYSLSLLNEDKDLDALLEAIRAGKILKKYKAIDSEVTSALLANIYDGRERNRLEGKNFVSSIANIMSLSVEIKLFASGSYNTIKLWDIETGKKIRTLQGVNLSIRSLCLSNNREVLASGSSDGIIKVWNLETGEEIYTLQGHDDSVSSVSLSGDGRILASGSDDSSIKIWNLETGEEIYTLQGHDDSVSSISFSNNGKILASGSDDSNIKVWNLETEKEIFAFYNHEYSVNSVSLSGDGKILASGSDDSSIKIWDLETGEEIYTLREHNDSINSVSLSNDGKVLVSGSTDRTIKLWNVEIGQEISTFQGHNNSVENVSLSSDGKIVASSSWNLTKLWNVDMEEEIYTLQGHNDSISSVGFSNDGKILISGSVDNTIKLWNLEIEEEIRTLQGLVNNYGFSILGQVNNDSIDFNFNTLSFSIGGKILAFKDKNRDIKLQSLETGKTIHILRGHNNFASSISLSGDGKIVAFDSDDRTIKLWNVETRKEIHTLQGHHLSILGLSLSSNGKVLASSSATSIKLWNVETGEELYKLEPQDGFSSINLSGNGKILASVSLNGDIELWNAKTGKRIYTLRGHSVGLMSVALSENGTLLASGGKDKNIKIWNVETGEEIHSFRGHALSVNSLSFSPNGKILASGGSDNTIRLWNLDLDYLMGRGCDRIRNYLKHNPNVKPEDRKLCDGIGSQ